MNLHKTQRIKTLINSDEDNSEDEHIESVDNEPDADVSDVEDDDEPEDVPFSASKESAEAEALIVSASIREHSRKLRDKRGSSRRETFNRSRTGTGTQPRVVESRSSLQIC